MAPLSSKCANENARHFDGGHYGVALRGKSRAGSTGFGGLVDAVDGLGQGRVELGIALLG